MVSAKTNNVIQAWAYFFLAAIMLSLAIFTFIVDPYTMEGGGKGGFYIALVATIGIFIELLFGKLATPIIFLLFAAFPVYKGYKLMGKNTSE